ncbi:MAG TPA: DinB family protein [Ktedonobacterales bacterium]|nr:DinB family protein [Ktedonobacterales bacterium]
MSDGAITLKEIYAGWDVYNRYLVEAVAPLTSEQLQLRPAANLRNVYEIVTHIIGARARWFWMLLGEGGETMAALGTWDRPGQPERNAAELEMGLEKTWNVISDCLSRWTIANLADTFPNDRADPGEPESFTRQWVIWHLIEHDLHHGGEMFYTLGMNGLPTPDL